MKQAITVTPPGALEPGGERYTFYLDKLRREIAAAGGIFPGKTRKEAIEMLRQTREQIYEEKYVAHFRRQRGGG
jgi:hypothetical protein